MRDDSIRALVGQSVDLQALAIKRIGETTDAALSISTSAALELKALYQALLSLPILGRVIRARFAARRAALIAERRAAQEAAAEPAGRA